MSSLEIATALVSANRFLLKDDRIYTPYDMVLLAYTIACKFNSIETKVGRRTPKIKTFIKSIWNAYKDLLYIRSDHGGVTMEIIYLLIFLPLIKCLRKTGDCVRTQYKSKGEPEVYVRWLKNLDWKTFQNTDKFSDVLKCCNDYFTQIRLTLDYLEGIVDSSFLSDDYSWSELLINLEGDGKTENVDIEALRLGIFKNLVD